MKRTSVLAQMALLCSSCIAISGCNIFAPNMGSEFPDGIASIEQFREEQKLPENTYVVEVRTNGKDPVRVVAPWENGMVLQDMVDATNMSRRFRRFDVEIERRTSKGLQRLPMRNAYDHSEKRMDPAHDYAIHPGDMIIVTEDTTSALSDMLGASPLGAAKAPFTRRL